MSKLTEASYPFFQGLELLTRMNPLMQISEVSIKVCFVGPPSHSINDNNLMRSSQQRRDIRERLERARRSSR
jgi:hypothetical protein